jgi:hypothetical protein
MGRVATAVGAVEGIAGWDAGGWFILLKPRAPEQIKPAAGIARINFIDDVLKWLKLRVNRLGMFKTDKMLLSFINSVKISCQFQQIRFLGRKKMPV